MATCLIPLVMARRAMTLGMSPECYLDFKKMQSVFLAFSTVESKTMASIPFGSRVLCDPTASLRLFQLLFHGHVLLLLLYIMLTLRACEVTCCRQQYLRSLGTATGR